jgi:hypothetical protein
MGHDAMAKFSLREAAEQAGKSKSTIFRAIKSGRLSAAKTDDGGFAIDASELFRVYPPVKGAVAPQRCVERSVGQDATAAERNATAHEAAIRMAELEVELRLLRDLLDEVKSSRDDMRQERDQLRAERDDWRGRAERLLTDQRAKPRPTGASAPRPPVEQREPKTGDVIETSIETGMAEIRRHLESLRAKAGH